MVMKDRLTKFMALLVIIALVGSVQAQTPTTTTSKSGYIVVGLYPHADFSADPVFGSIPLVVVFTDKSGGSTPRTYQWNFGDGGTSTAMNPTHTYLAAGVYTVTLTITNAYGSDTMTKADHVRVGIAPIANFAANPMTGNVPLSVAFTDQSTGNPTTWSWDFGDGSTSTQQNPSHTYTLAGIYTVSLTVTNAYGTATKSITGFITAGMPPAADFTASTRAGPIPLSVKFTDTSRGGPSAWSWDFGDGTTSTDRYPTHVYTRAGIFTVVLTASNAYGSDKETKTGYVSAGAAPVADFASDIRAVDVPGTVQFADRSLNGPTSWSWSFGDGATSQGKYTNHTYSAPGIYTVALTVSNSYGSDTVTKKNFINAGGAPVADFSATPTSIMVPATVKFTDLSTRNPSSWSWDFGDGSISSEKNPSHTYTAAGTYTVSLTVRNGYGMDKKTKAAFINAGAKPVADFTADERVGTAPFTVMFTDLSTGNPTSWSWDFGDGGTSTEQNPMHVYRNEGAYDVSLTVTNAFGTDTEKKTGTMAPGATGVTPKTTSVTTPKATVPPAQGTTAQATTAVPQQTEMPGFEGILAITGLAALVYLAKRH